MQIAPSLIKLYSAAPVVSCPAKLCAFLILLTFSGMGFVQTAMADLPLLFSDSRINMPPPGASVAAGYMSIKNSSDTDMKIVSASSDAFKKVEMHESTVENDVAKMRKQDSLEIKAGETLELKHSGFHLMLMGIVNPLEAGKSIPITLTTESGASFTVDFDVQMPGMKKSHTSKTNSEDHSNHGSD